MKMGCNNCEEKNDAMVYATELSVKCLNHYVAGVLSMAEDNWGQMAQFDLKRLLAATMMNKPYSRIKQAEVDDFVRNVKDGERG